MDARARQTSSKASSASSNVATRRWPANSGYRHDLRTLGTDCLAVDHDKVARHAANLPLTGRAVQVSQATRVALPPAYREIEPVRQTWAPPFEPTP